MTEPLGSTNELETTVDSAAQRGAEEARKISSEIIPSIKAAARKLGYGFAFGTAYSGSFAVTLVKELTPRTLKEGFADGAGAGRSAAENLMEAKVTREEEAVPTGANMASA